MRNLLAETLEVLEENGKAPADVRWVGTPSHYMTFPEFADLANRMYNAGYGAPKVATDLRIVGDDWYLERAEYDGSEWWEFKRLPILLPDAQHVPSWRFFVSPQQVGWETFSRINNPEDEEDNEEEREDA